MCRFLARVWGLGASYAERGPSLRRSAAVRNDVFLPIVKHKQLGGAQELKEKGGAGPERGVPDGDFK